MKPIVKLAASCLLAMLALSTAAARADDLTILTSGAFKPVVMALVPAFEAAHSAHVVVENDTAGALMKKIEGGAAFDLVILTPALLTQLGERHLVESGSATPLAKVGISVAVKAGAPRPDISSVEAFKRSLLQARSIAYIDPASGGSSGIYLAKLMQRLKLADALKAKTVLVPGGLVGERITNGDAELGIHQTSELLPVPGLEIVGPLPEEIQSYTTYAAALGAHAHDRAAAAQFLAALAGEPGHAAITAKGMIALHR